MRKYILGVFSLILIALSIWVYLIFSGDDKKRRGGKTAESVVSVKTQVVQNKSIPLKVHATGRVAATHSLRIFAQVEGIMERASQSFRAGNYYKKGSPLVKISKEVAAANFRSQKADFYNLLLSMMSDLRIDYKEAYARWERYVSSIDLNSLSIPPLPEVESEKEKLFLAARKVFSMYYTLSSQQIRLRQYQISAPFDGMLSATLIREGSLIRSGQELGTYISTRDFEVQVFLAARYLPFLKENQPVIAKKVEGMHKHVMYKGRIRRINRNIDTNTQTFEVTVKITGDDLVQGLYMSLEIEGLPQPNCFEVDRGLLVDGRYLYVVEEGKLLRKEIDPVIFGERKLIFKGLANGAILVTSRLSKAYDEMPVNVMTTQQ